MWHVDVDFCHSTFKPALWCTLHHNRVLVVFCQKKPLSVGSLICQPEAPLHFIPSGDLSATMLSALSLVLVHELAAAITSLTGRVLLLTTCLDISPFQQIVDF